MEQDYRKPLNDTDRDLQRGTPVVFFGFLNHSFKTARRKENIGSYADFMCSPSSPRLTLLSVVQRVWMIIGNILDSVDLGKPFKKRAGGQSSRYEAPDSSPLASHLAMSAVATAYPQTSPKDNAMVRLVRPAMPAGTAIFPRTHFYTE